jgi:hypothetical protein
MRHVSSACGRAVGHDHASTTEHRAPIEIASVLAPSGYQHNDMPQFMAGPSSYKQDWCLPSLT